MKNLPIISGWEPKQLRDQAKWMRVRADAVAIGFWCQGAGARDDEGDRVDPAEAGACQFCAGSHIDYFTPHPILGLELIEQSVPVVRVTMIPNWNDKPGRKAYQVARAFRAAAARAERYARILEAEQVSA